MNEFIKAIFLSDICGIEKLNIPHGKKYEELNKKEEKL